MDRWLSWRIAVPSSVLLFGFAYVAPPRVVDVALVVTAGLPLLACRRLVRTAPQVRFSAVGVACAQVFAVVMCLDRLVNGGTAGVIGSAAGVLAVVGYSMFSLGIVRARRPAEYRDGIIDGFAAAAGALAVQGQYAALQPGATTGSVAAGLTPFIGAFHMLALATLFYGVVRDPRQNKLIPLMVIFPSVLLVAAMVGHESYTIADPPAWATGLPLAAGFLIAAVLAHPDFGTMFLAEPPRRRIVQMRWLGPLGALLATPLMLLLFVWHGAAPTVGGAVTCLALTTVALWRGGKMLREREQSRRDLFAEQRFRELVEHAADVVVILGADRRIAQVTGAVHQLPAGSGDLIGRDIGLLFDERDTRLLLSAVDQLPPGGHSTAQVPTDLQLLSASTGPRWVAISVTDHRDTPQISGWVLNIRDVTARKSAEAAMLQLALEDGLTGLPNRARMRTHLESALDRDLGAAPTTTAVLFCDLDGFKAVNDRLGHESGDEVLREVGRRWSAVLGEQDVLGRWGGDEFLVVCSDVQGAEEASVVAGRLHAALGSALRLSTGVADIGVSIGLAVHAPGETADELLARADAEMYLAKRSNGRQRVA